MSASEAGGAPLPLGAREGLQQASRSFRQTAWQFLPGVKGWERDGACTQGLLAPRHMSDARCCVWHGWVGNHQQKVPSLRCD